MQGLPPAGGSLTLSFDHLASKVTTDPEPHSDQDDGQFPRLTTWISENLMYKQFSSGKSPLTLTNANRFCATGKPSAHVGHPCGMRSGFADVGITQAKHDTAARAIVRPVDAACMGNSTALRRIWKVVWIPCTEPGPVAERWRHCRSSRVGSLHPTHSTTCASCVSWIWTAGYLSPGPCLTAAFCSASLHFPVFPWSPDS